MAQPFTDAAWSRNAALIAQIHELPFNIELAAGTLDRARFANYIAQDSLYLRRYSHALAVCAAKAPTQDATDFFASSAHVAIEVERSMHAGFLDRLGVSKREVDDAEMSLACQAYTDFLIAACYERSYAVAAAAILPCFWIYEDVGRAIAGKAAADNPYQPWIDTYSDDAFAEAVRTAKRLTDDAAAAASDAERDLMHDAFTRSTQYEWLFWDSAYHLRGWPITSEAATSA